MTDLEQKLFGVHAWRWQTLAAMASLLGIATIMLAGWKFYAETEARKVDKTLEITAQWVDQHYDEDFAALRDMTTSTISSIPSDQREAIDSDPHLAANARRKVSELVLSQPGEMRRFDRIVFYFNFVGLCVEAGVCSSKVAKTFFSGTAQRFEAMFESEIESRQSEDAQYAEGLIFLARLNQ